MRTTIAIDDNLLAQAKRRARLLGLTLGQLVEEALRLELSRSLSPGERPPVPVFRGGSGLRPGLDGASNRSLLEELDRESGAEKLR
jgi:hypothetical protein